MAEQLTKLRPDRDLQCYFEKPSAVAALSGAAADRFTVSGTWRQQFDWAVVEWNRDNVFEHPTLRNLPDGDLRGMRLVYQEQRTNCIPLDSDLFPTVDWPYVRVWADGGTGETFYRVRLKDHATAVEGAYRAATAEFTLAGTPAGGDYIGVSWLEERHTYQLYGTDSVENAIAAVAASVNAFSPIMKAEAAGTTLRLRYVGTDRTTDEGSVGANGNRLGAYTYAVSAGLSWSAAQQTFSGGTSPTKWQVSLNFDGLVDIQGRTVPVQSVRKMRWTYAADLQAGAFTRSEFAAQVSEWQVTGDRRTYKVAGPGSRRWENTSMCASYEGAWSTARGNFSGGSIHHTTTPGAAVTCRVRADYAGSLYLGTRYANSGASVRAIVDGGTPKMISLAIPQEDVLARISLGIVAPGEHTVRLEHAGTAGTGFYFDFLECAVAAADLPAASSKPTMTLATDWDTDHSIALPPERTAWMIDKLGFRGRANYYVGALWFYELSYPGHQYASLAITFGGENEPNKITSLRVGRTGEPAANDAVLDHLHHVGDSPEKTALAFALRLNNGYTGVWAEVSGAVLTIRSRALGTAGNVIRVSAATNSSTLTIGAAGPTLSGGTDGQWTTDLSATPRLNRAVRDWTRAFASALASVNIPVTAAFSTELQHGPTDLASGVAQRYPSGNPVVLNTPAIQTNFSPESLAYWRDVYAEAAKLLVEGGQTPYLQFGEVQWWYFPYDGSGMPFYDEYTKSTFAARFGRPLPVIASNLTDPAAFTAECAFLASLIGDFTQAIQVYVRSRVPGCRFEVLYPTDVNDSALNTLVNYPPSAWTPANLDNLKTENFTYTGSRQMNLTQGSVDFGSRLGFPASKRSHLIGLSDADTPWLREVQQSENAMLESTVLFALDQFCLIGYSPQMTAPRRRSTWSR